jgi:hypothetical protein
MQGLDNILLMLRYTETRSTLGAHFCQRKNLSILPTDVFALTMWCTCKGFTLFVKWTFCVHMSTWLVCPVNTSNLMDFFLGWKNNKYYFQKHVFSIFFLKNKNSLYNYPKCFRNEFTFIFYLYLFKYYLSIWVMSCFNNMMHM